MPEGSSTLNGQGLAQGIFQGTQNFMGKGLYIRHIGVCCVVLENLPVEKNLFIQLFLQVFKTEKIFIAVKIGSKPNPTNQSVIFQQVIGSYLEKQVQSGIEVKRSTCECLIRCIEEAKIDLVDQLVWIEGSPVVNVHHIIVLARVDYQIQVPAA